MTKQEFTALLKNQGWEKKVFSSYERWICGKVILYIKNDCKGKPYVKYSDKEWGYIETIKNVNFTPFRILIQWNLCQEWYLQY